MSSARATDSAESTYLSSTYAVVRQLGAGVNYIALSSTCLSRREALAGDAGLTGAADVRSSCAYRRVTLSRVEAVGSTLCPVACLNRSIEIDSDRVSSHVMCWSGVDHTQLLECSVLYCIQFDQNGI